MHLDMAFNIDKHSTRASCDDLCQAICADNEKAQGEAAQEIDTTATASATGKVKIEGTDDPIKGETDKPKEKKVASVAAGMMGA